jgi:pseudaminic acid synthase
MKSPCIRIGKKLIGKGQAPFVIAELSGNHKNDFNCAIKLIAAAKACGADAVKLQTFTADTMTIDHQGPGFVKNHGLWKGRSLYDLYNEASTPWAWHADLFEYARDIGLIIFSSPFDPTAVQFLEKLGCPAYKIASLEITDTQLIKTAAQTGKPLIFSTGAGSKSDIKRALDVAQQYGSGEIVVLHCVSSYPAPASEMNLMSIPIIENTFDVITGLSDHSLGTAAAVTSVALGSKVIEKHFILSRDDGGVDASFSLEPEEFSRLTIDVKTAWEALGNNDFEAVQDKAAMHQSRCSIYAVEMIEAGEELTASNIKIIRPGFGLPAYEYENIIGKKARFDIERGTPLSWPMIQDGRKSKNR